MTFKTTATKEELSRSGIYYIKNCQTNKLYIGSTNHFHRRHREHSDRLRRKEHHSGHLQASFNKYGHKVFEFGILEITSKDKLIECEQYWMDTLQPEYNISQIAGRNPMTAETKAKISLKTKGIPKSKEQAEFCRKLRCGTKLSEEHKEAIYKANSKAYIFVSPDLQKYYVDYRMPVFARDHGISVSSVTCCAKGKLDHASGWQCFYAEEFTDDKIKKLSPTCIKGSRSYIVTTPTGEEIKINNLNGFAKENGIDPSNMFKILKGKAKTCKGYTVRETT